MATTMEWLEKAMAHWSDRGPEDYERDINDLRDLVANAVREGSRRANIEISGYNEGGGGSWNWVKTALATLAVSGIVGNVIQYAEVASLKTAFQDFAAQMERRVNTLEQRASRIP